MNSKIVYDAIIVGGSYSGLSAAMSLGRFMQKVLIIDGGKPCNRFAAHSHNFLAHDNDVPGDISYVAKEQVLKYDTVSFVQGLAVGGSKVDNLFEIEADSGAIFLGKNLVLAAGIKDILPSFKGAHECWGISLIHCPYCHGYEHRNERHAILANGDAAAYFASMLNKLTANLTVLTNGPSTLTEEQSRRLEANNIKVVETKVAELLHEDGKIQYVSFEDNSRMSMDVVYPKLAFEQNAQALIEAFGIEKNPAGYIAVDGMMHTNVEHVFACGDAVSPMRTLSHAVHTGSSTGMFINKSLVSEVFEQAKKI